MNVLVLHGPNLDLLGRRPGDDPGLSLPALDRNIAERARHLGLSVRSLHSNHEGALLDALRNPGAWADAVVLSPGLLALTSHVLREAVAAAGVPVVEVHLHDASGKASVRRHSLLQDVCAARVVGEGPDGYLHALERLASGIRGARVPRSAPAAVPPPRKEPLGRRTVPPPAAPSAPPAARPAKTLGRRTSVPPARTTTAAPGRGAKEGVLSRATLRRAHCRPARRTADAGRPCHLGPQPVAGTAARGTGGKRPARAPRGHAATAAARTAEALAPSG